MDLGQISAESRGAWAGSSAWIARSKAARFTWRRGEGARCWLLPRRGEEGWAPRCPHLTPATPTTRATGASAATAHTANAATHDTATDTACAAATTTTTTAAAATRAAAASSAAASAASGARLLLARLDLGPISAASLLHLCRAPPSRTP